MFELDNVSDLLPEAAALLENQLEEDEQVFWAAQPIAKRILLKTLPASIFGIVFASFAVFFMSKSSVTGAPAPFMIMPVLFLLIGLGATLSPLMVARSAKKTVYAITQKRAMIIKPGGFGAVNVRTFLPDALDDIEISCRADGSGDIILDKDYHRSKNGTRTVKIGFIAIADVKKAEKYLRVLADSEKYASEDA